MGKVSQAVNYGAASCLGQADRHGETLRCDAMGVMIAFRPLISLRSPPASLVKIISTPKRFWHGESLNPVQDLPEGTDVYYLDLCG